MKEKPKFVQSYFCKYILKRLSIAIDKMHTYNIRCSDMILWSFQTENCECIKFLQHQTNPNYINPHRMKILQWYLEVKWLVKQSASCCKFSFLTLDMIKLFCFTGVMQDLYKPVRMLCIENITFLFKLQKSIVWKMLRIFRSIITTR